MPTLREILHRKQKDEFADKNSIASKTLLGKMLPPDRPEPTPLNIVQNTISEYVNNKDVKDNSELTHEDSTEGFVNSTTPQINLKEPFHRYNEYKAKFEKIELKDKEKLGQKINLKEPFYRYDEDTAKFEKIELKDKEKLVNNRKNTSYLTKYRAGKKNQDLEYIFGRKKGSVFVDVSKSTSISKKTVVNELSTKVPGTTGKTTTSVGTVLPENLLILLDNIHKTVEAVSKSEKYSYSGLKPTEPTSIKTEGDGVKFIFDVFGNKGIANEKIIFNSYLENITDTFTTNYTEYTHVGRPEILQKYSRTNRSMSISFKLVAEDRKKLGEEHRKLKRLISCTHPRILKNNVQSGVVVKLTVGNLYYKVPGVITSVTPSYTPTYKWNTEGTGVGEEVSIKNLNGKQNYHVPHVLDVSLQFEPVYDKVPEFKDYALDKTYLENINALSKNKKTVSNVKSREGFSSPKLSFSSTEKDTKRTGPEKTTEMPVERWEKYVKNVVTTGNTVSEDVLTLQKLKLDETGFTKAVEMFGKHLKQSVEKVNTSLQKTTNSTGSNNPIKKLTKNEITSINVTNNIILSKLNEINEKLKEEILRLKLKKQVSSVNVRGIRNEVFKVKTVFEQYKSKVKNTCITFFNSIAVEHLKKELGKGYETYLDYVKDGYEATIKNAFKQNPNYRKIYNKLRGMEPRKSTPISPDPTAGVTFIRPRNQHHQHLQIPPDISDPLEKTMSERIKKLKDRPVWV